MNDDYVYATWEERESVKNSDKTVFLMSVQGFPEYGLMSIKDPLGTFTFYVFKAGPVGSDGRKEWVQIKYGPGTSRAGETCGFFWFLGWSDKFILKMVADAIQRTRPGIEVLEEHLAENQLPEDLTEALIPAIADLRHGKAGSWKSLHDRATTLFDDESYTLRGDFTERQEALDRLLTFLNGGF